MASGLNKKGGYAFTARVSEAISRPEAGVHLKRKPGLLSPTPTISSGGMSVPTPKRPDYKTKSFALPERNTGNFSLPALGAGKSTPRRFDANRPETNIGKREVPKKEDGRDFQLFSSSIARMGQIASSGRNLKLFEIFGKVSSPVVRHQKYDALEFVLRDDTDAVSCIYYVYNPEAKIERGVHYRCVGRISPQDGSRLHCLSIRPSTELEKKFMRDLIGP